MSEEKTEEKKEEQEEAARQREAAFYRRLCSLLDIPFIAGIGPLASAMTKNRILNMLDCYRHAVLNLMLGEPLPEFRRPEPKKRIKTNRRRR